MNKTSLWIVVVVTAAWIGFLMGYAVSAHTGSAQATGHGSETTGKDGGGASAGGYGK
jgi:hypothetical protein